MMSGCGATTVVDNQTTHTSLFSWNRELIDNDPSEVMAKLSDYHIDRIYQGLYPTDLENENTAKLVSGLQDLGIEAVYLTGDPDWNDENVVIEWTIDKLIAYNKGVGNGSEIKTICYDAEFYSNDRADEDHFSAYVHMMEAMRSGILGLKGMEGVNDAELKGIQEAIKENERIERYYLKTLVNKLTFPDYEHLTIHWKDGRRVTLPLKTTAYWAHPYPEVGKREGDFVEYGGQNLPIRRLEKAESCIENRNRYVQNLEITMPDPEALIQIPVVKKEKGVK